MAAETECGAVVTARCPWPGCGEPLDGLGRYCHACLRYADDVPRDGSTSGEGKEGSSSPDPGAGEKPPTSSGVVRGITLPLPPSANDLTRSVARIRGMKEVRAAVEARDWRAVEAALDRLDAFVSVTTSREGRLWKTGAADWLAAQGVTPLAKGVPASVRASLYFPNDRRDLDNGIKPLLDVLQGWCLTNDRQVRHVEVWKLFDRERPRTELVVGELGPVRAPRLAEQFTLTL